MFQIILNEQTSFMYGDFYVALGFCMGSAVVVKAGFILFW